ncbi:MAG: hypothetical protein AB1449_09890 [Chloroflexota bacterium]
MSGFALSLARRWARAEAAALALALAAAAASAWVAWNVFEGIPHVEDEIAQLWQAEIVADGRIYLQSPPAPRSFLVPFVVDYEGRRFGKYPPGWPAALSLGVRAGAPWLVNPILAGLSAWLIYRLGAKVFGRGVGLLAEALTITSPMFLMLSGSLMGHGLSLFLATAFWLAWLDLFPREGAGEHNRVPVPLLVGVAGLSLGLLALIRPLTAVGVVLPCAGHALFFLWRGRAAAGTRLIGAAALAIGVTALLPLWQAALTGDPWLNPYTLWWSYDRIGFGPGIGRTESGHNLSWALINTRHSLNAGLHDLFGWPYLSWLFLPFGLVAGVRRPKVWLLFAAFPSLVIVYMAYWIGSWLFGPRYYFEALPGLAVVTAAGIGWLGGWLTTKARPPDIFRRGLVVLVLSLLVSANVAFYLPLRLSGMRGLYGISRQRVEPLQAAHLEHALVIVHPQHNWTDYGTLLSLTPPFADSDLLLIYSWSPADDRRAVSFFPDRRVYHYYPDEPETLYPAHR